MGEEVKKKKKVRRILWIIIAVLSAATLVLWFLSYRTLQTVTTMSDQTADSQSKNFRFYVNEYKVTKVALDETTVKLEQVTQELEAANAELSTTRTELSSLQQLNDQLKTDIQSLERYKDRAKAKGEALETMINAFKKKNRELDSNLQIVRKELATFQPEIGDVEEGRAKVLRFKNHIKKVKLNMTELKRKAIEAKIAAQKERDRLEAIYGNGGFLVKDGQDKSVTKFDANKVDIQVQFINQ